MDTYFSTNYKCEKCGLCAEECHKNGEQWLTAFVTDDDEICYIDGISDYVPCHHCDGFWEDKTPCQKVCPNGAIELERW